MEQIAGVCPECGKSEFVYDVFEPEGDGGYYPCVCSFCNWEGREWYSMDFTCFTDEE